MSGVFGGFGGEWSHGLVLEGEGSLWGEEGFEGGGVGGGVVGDYVFEGALVLLERLEGREGALGEGEPFLVPVEGLAQFRGRWRVGREDGDYLRD